MPIGKTLFEQLSDRIAWQAKQVSSGLDLARDPDFAGYGGYKRYRRIHSGIDVTGDYTAENTLISSAESLDDGTNLDRNSHLTTIFSAVIGADGTYATNLGFSDLDGYLYQSGINVAPEYEITYYYVNGSHLRAVNVFGPSVNPMGTVVFSSSGVAVFTDGSVVGTGTGTVSNSNHAAANIEVVVNSGIGANPIHLDIYATIEGASDGTTEARTLTLEIPNTAVVGNVYPVGTTGNKGDMALDVTNVIVAGGASGDALIIRSKQERTIAP